MKGVGEEQARTRSGTAGLGARRSTEGNTVTMRITQRLLGAYTAASAARASAWPKSQAISRAAARWRATVLRGDLLGLEKKLAQTQIWFWFKGYFDILF